MKPFQQIGLAPEVARAALLQAGDQGRRLTLGRYRADRVQKALETTIQNYLRVGFSNPEQKSDSELLGIFKSCQNFGNRMNQRRKQKEIGRSWDNAKGNGGVSRNLPKSDTTRRNASSATTREIVGEIFNESV